MLLVITVNDNKLSSNKITMGNKIELIADGVDYYEIKDGKISAGCIIILTDKAGK